jgi:hypothetical protein
MVFAPSTRGIVKAHHLNVAKCRGALFGNEFWEGDRLRSTPD